MESTPLALVIAAALAAVGIKRGANRPPPVEPPAPGPEAYQQVSVLPNRLDGGGLRSAVTEKEDRDEGDEPADVKETGMSLRARTANAAGSSQRADVVGEAPRQVVRQGSDAAPTVSRYVTSISPAGVPGKRAAPPQHVYT